MNDVVTGAIKAGGGTKALATKLGMSAEGVRLWRTRGVPAKRVLEVESITGIPREQLRPDLYRREDVQL